MRFDADVQRREQSVLRSLLFEPRVGGRRRSAILQAAGNYSLAERARVGCTTQGYLLNVECFTWSIHYYDQQSSVD